MRTRLAPLLFACAACAERPAGVPPGPLLPGPPPNVLLLVADGLDPGVLAGATAWDTPALDALVAAGTRFSGAAATSDVGAAARWSLLSGAWPREHGVRAPGDAPAADLVTLPARLAAAGYETVAFALATRGSEPELGFERGAWRRDPEAVVPETPEARTGGEAAAWLGARGSAGRPFFAWVDLGALPVWSAAAAGGSGPVPDVRMDEARREVEALDTSLGELVATLASADLGASTLTVLTATHPRLRAAAAAPAPRLGPRSVAVPLVLALPGRVPAGELRPQLVTHLDLVATLAELCGAPVPVDDRRGSFARLLLKRPQPWRDVDFAEAGGGAEPLVRAVWQERWKLVWKSGEEPRLYDREADPDERRDLYADPAPAAARAAADLSSRLLEWGE